MIKTQPPIITAFQADLVNLFEKYPIALAYLFGSSAKNTATPLSDVDIALLVEKDEYDPKKRLRFELILEDEIDQINGLDNVDVRVINEAPLIIRGEVVTNGLLIFSKNDQQRVDFETQTRSRYFDFLPFITEIDRAYLENISRYGMLRDRPKEN